MPDTFLCGPDDANPPRNASYWKRKTKVMEARVAELEADRKDMGALIRQFSYWLNKFAPDHTLTIRAADYLKRKGLEPTLLRDEPTY